MALKKCVIVFYYYFSGLAIVSCACVIIILSTFYWVIVTKIFNLLFLQTWRNYWLSRLLYLFYNKCVYIITISVFRPVHLLRFQNGFACAKTCLCSKRYWQDVAREQEDCANMKTERWRNENERRCNYWKRAIFFSSYSYKSFRQTWDFRLFHSFQLRLLSFSPWYCYRILLHFPVPIYFLLY